MLPELLRMLEIKGCVVTLDAMGCQKKVAAQIIEQKGDCLISLKGNQSNLHQGVADCRVWPAAAHLFTTDEAISEWLKSPSTIFAGEPPYNASLGRRH